MRVPSTGSTPPPPSTPHIFLPLNCQLLSIARRTHSISGHASRENNRQITQPGQQEAPSTEMGSSAGGGDGVRVSLSKSSEGGEQSSHSHAGNSVSRVSFFFISLFLSRFFPCVLLIITLAGRRKIRPFFCSWPQFFFGVYITSVKI